MSVRDMMTPKSKEEIIKNLENHNLAAPLITLIRNNDEVYEAVREGFSVPIPNADTLAIMLNRIWAECHEEKK